MPWGSQVLRGFKFFLAATSDSAKKDIRRDILYDFGILNLISISQTKEKMRRRQTSFTRCCKT